MQKQHYFVTGTDTAVGKTHIACSLLARAKAQGKNCVGIKPVTAGCTLVDGELISEDAQKLLAASSTKLPADLQAPIKLATACSPHIAATMDSKTLTADRITGLIRGALSVSRASHILVEGAGGWHTPVNDRENLSDVALQLGLPVILVVGVRLGCLNHAQLTVQAIAGSGACLAGWVANEVQPNTAHFTEQTTYLSKHITAPCLGVVRFGEDAQKKVHWLDERQLG